LVASTRGSSWVALTGPVTLLGEVEAAGLQNCSQAASAYSRDSCFSEAS